MISTHSLAPLEAHFARSLEGPGPDAAAPSPINHGDFVGEDTDYGRGLMFAFPTVWQKMTVGQRLKAVYIASCIDKGVGEPAVLREWMP